MGIFFYSGRFFLILLALGFALATVVCIVGFVQSQEGRWTERFFWRGVKLFGIITAIFVLLALFT